MLIGDEVILDIVELLNAQCPLMCTLWSISPDLLRASLTPPASVVCCDE